MIKKDNHSYGSQKKSPDKYIYMGGATIKVLGL